MTISSVMSDRIKIHDYVDFINVKATETDEYFKKSTSIKKLDRAMTGCVVRILKSGDLKVDTGSLAMGVVTVRKSDAFLREQQQTIV